MSALRQLARDIADEKAPPPIVAPISGGLILAGFAVVVMATGRWYDLPLPAFESAIIIACSFCLPYIYLYLQRQENRLARTRAYLRLREQDRNAAKSDPDLDDVLANWPLDIENSVREAKRRYH